MSSLICPICPPERTSHLKFNLTKFMKHVILTSQAFPLLVVFTDVSVHSGISEPFRIMYLTITLGVTTMMLGVMVVSVSQTAFLKTI